MGSTPKQSMRLRCRSSRPAPSRLFRRRKLHHAYEYPCGSLASSASETCLALTHTLPPVPAPYTHTRSHATQRTQRTHARTHVRQVSGAAIFAGKPFQCEMVSNSGWAPGATQSTCNHRPDLIRLDALVAAAESAERADSIDPLVAGLSGKRYVVYRGAQDPVYQEVGSISALNFTAVGVRFCAIKAVLPPHTCLVLPIHARYSKVLYRNYNF